MDPNKSNTDPSNVTASPVSAPSTNEATMGNPLTAPTPSNPLTMTPSVQIGKPDLSQPGATAGIPQSPKPIESISANPMSSFGSGSSDQIGSQPGPTPPAIGVSSSIPVTPHKGKPMMWVIILLILSFFCGLLLAAWYFQTQLQKVTPAKQTSQAPIETPKKFVIGTDATFQPMEYVASGGALMGYDIDLGRQIGEELGAQVEFKNIAWDDVFKALEKKEVDMVISSVTITEERKQIYEFSDNYLNAGQVIITRRDEATITSADSLKDKKIAVQEGTTNETQALKLTTPNLVIRYADFVLATKALVDGKADAILSDLPGAKGIITTNPTLKIASDPLTNEYYGIAFRKGDPNIKKINEALSSLSTKGILTDLKQKWLD